MKFSFNLAKKFSDDDFDGLLGLEAGVLAERLNGQVGAFDSIEFQKEKYKGIVTAKIVKAEQHPNADRLKVCMIDDGGVVNGVERTAEGMVQVVCGAPNAEQGMMVAWIPPGAIVPMTFDDTEPFILSSVDLRGVKSNGMLASPKELGISDEHEGIVDLGGYKSKPGDKLADIMVLDDVIVDFENKMFTKRPDCFGQIGIARELSGIEGIKFTSPDWYLDLTPEWPGVDSELQVDVENKIRDVCPRYMAVIVESVDAGASPLWLQASLSAVGVRPINKLVDITNYMMVISGQPLHAFDAGKLGDKIGVRAAIDGEGLEILGGKKIKLDVADIVITNGDSPIALGGVMGGANTEVNNNTTSIVLEVANFDMYSIRRTSMRHGLFTDAVTRFTKGQSPEQAAPVLGATMQMIKELCPEAKFGEVIDVGGEKFKKVIINKVEVSLRKINDLLGLDLKIKEVVDILKSVELGVAVVEENLTVAVPFWRRDIEIAEDIVEEVGRLYGFNKIEPVLPVKPINLPRDNRMLILKKKIGSVLQELGCNELTNYSFVSAKLLEKANQEPDMAYAIRNALSPDLEHYRMSIVPSLLEKVNSNIRDGYSSVTIYEVGKAHIKKHTVKDPQTGVELPDEFDRLGLVVASKDRSSANNGAPFYLAKRYVNSLLERLQVPFTFVELNEKMISSKVPILSVYTKGRVAGIEIAGEIRGVVGEFNPKAAKSFKLPGYCSGFELDLELLAREYNSDFDYTPLSEFPKMYKDLTVEAKDGENYSDVLARVVGGIEKEVKKKDIKFEIKAKSIYREDGSDEVAYTFSLELWHMNRTLKTKEANDILSKFE